MVKFTSALAATSAILLATYAAAAATPVQDPLVPQNNGCACPSGQRCCPVAAGSPPRCVGNNELCRDGCSTVRCASDYHCCPSCDDPKKARCYPQKTSCPPCSSNPTLKATPSGN